ncbi:hypothetical protein BGZ50_004071 [Haplosporangium sp. Z 11]|nr:hypothetical protein BGZ50_004071 [Haplosporangium sp. Z 11]
MSTKDTTSIAVETGVLELHYIELRHSRLEGYSDESSIIAHRPYLWSLDVRMIEHIPKGDTPIVPTWISAYAISGDERYAATLASTNANFIFILTVWDLVDTVASDVVPKLAITNKDQQDLRSKAASYRPKAIAGAIVTFSEPLVNTDSEYRVSLSWDGSKVAVGDDVWGKEVPETTLSVYHYERDPLYSQTAKTNAASAASATMQQLVDYQLCTELDDFHGYGMFHITDSRNLDVKKELFLAHDKERVLIFSVYPTWKHLHTITIGNHGNGWHTIGLQDQFLATMHHPYTAVKVWDIALKPTVSILSHGRKVSSMRDTVAFSADGNLMAMAIGWHTSVSLHWRTTGTTLGSCTPPTTGSSIYSMRFIQNDTCILAYVRNDNIPIREEAIIIDVYSMTIVDRVTFPQAYSARMLIKMRSDATYYSVHGTILDLAPSYIQTRIACSDRCFRDLMPLEDCRIFLTKEQPTELTMPSGLHYHFELQYVYDFTTFRHRPYLVVSITSMNSTSSKRLTLPSLHHGADEDTLTLHAASMTLVDTNGRQILVWRLPAALDDDAELQVARRVGGSHQWVTCVHGEIYSISKNQDRDQTIKPCHLERHVPFRNPEEDIFFLIYLLNDANDASQKAILQYVSPHINGRYDPEHPSDTLITTICRTWNYDLDDIYGLFLQELLAFPSKGWIVKPDTVLDANPLWILLAHAKKKAQFMRHANTLIDYCFRQTRAEKDHILLFPVLQSLHALIDSKGHHVGLAAQVLKRFVYLPVKDRQYIIDHHSIVRPPEFRWQFWKPNTRPLYQCLEPILQLEPNSTLNDLNEYFTREVCVAPFALLWRYNGDIVYCHSRPFAPLSSVSFSWIRALAALIWYKTKLAPEKDVKCHDFSLEMLNNPAIVALIEYKWNTMGFNYCMLRFLLQICYYLLVLTVVFLQVYGGYHGTLSGAFIAVTVCSVIFLWLELTQIVRSWRRYFSTLYNVVDWFVFGLPLAASINYLFIIPKEYNEDAPKDGNAGFLSFSVLFIFLHFLFELRINKSVCKFVTIIVRVFIRIRLFFFISIGVILAFTIAMLHLLHSCQYVRCENTSKFPSHFYSAIVATFLYMGGRYDSINDELDSENWAFLTMMMVYFFFTVILMLNVLIALINAAFIDGDETWRLVWLENRLRVIESFREHLNYFPNEVYYTATTEEIEKYQEQNFADDLNNAPKRCASPEPSSLAIAKPNIIQSGKTYIPSIPDNTDTSEAAENSMKEELKEQLTVHMQAQAKALQDQVQASVERESGALQERIERQVQAALQEQSVAHQAQMKEIQALLATFLASKADVGPS